MTQPVVIAEKVLHKGAMFGNVSNGGGIISLGNGKSIKFIAVNDKYVKLQLLESGIGTEIATQSWQKTKTVTQTKIVERPQKIKTSQIKLKDANMLETEDLL